MKNQLYESFIIALKHEHYDDALRILRRVFEMDVKRRVAVHGSLFNPYFKAIV